MQRSGTPRHAERGQHARQTEAVVTVQVADEYGYNPRETYVQSAELDLRSFPAVDQELLLPKFYDLRRGEMLQSRQGAATAKDPYGEWFHKML